MKFEDQLRKILDKNRYLNEKEKVQMTKEISLLVELFYISKTQT